MALRHRALARLHRHVPHVVGTDERVLATRLGDRTTDPSPGPKVAGEAVRVRDEVHERALRGPEPGPNAPLLIRLVRSPYALHPVHAGRRPNTQRAHPSEGRPTLAETVSRTSEWFEEAHVAVGESRLDRIRLEHRDPPFVRRRAAANSTDDDAVPLGAP